MRVILPFLVLLLTAPASAQTLRYELGQRLRAFEEAWETAPADGKKRALKIVDKVTNQFFSFQLGEAGRTLDDARHTLTSDKPRPVAQQWADCLYAEPASRLPDGKATELAVTVQAFYPVKADKPKGLAVRLTLGDRPPVNVTIDKLPAAVKLPLPEARFADFPLKVETLVGGKVVTTRAIGVSRIGDGGSALDDLLAAGKTVLPKGSLELATLTDRVALLKELAGGTITETDYPAAKLLTEAGEMVSDGGKFDPLLLGLLAEVRKLKAVLAAGEFTVDPTAAKQGVERDPKVTAKAAEVAASEKELVLLREKLLPTAPRMKLAESAHADLTKQLTALREAAVKTRIAELKAEREKATKMELATAEKEVAGLLRKPNSTDTPFFAPHHAGQLWLTVPTEKTATACRLLVPKNLDAKKPVPLVVALHGAGGSENLFFEGYGAGQIVKLCEQRGWLLVAPRLGLGLVGATVPVGAVVDKLAERYPINRKAVFVVGHSMGASAAVEAVQKYPGTFAAAAALGGGGRVKAETAGAFAKLPTFIGVGGADALALNGAKGLNKALIESGAGRVKLKVYADVEHLVIVRQALPEVFALFDKQARPEQ